MCSDGGVVADVPGARLRALLAALALEPGRVVAKPTLVDWIWGEHLPSGAANSLQRLVSRLRKALPEGTIEGGPGGYRLTVAPDAVDAVQFERLVERARREAGPGRVRLLREALALWRGPAMADVGLQDSAAFGAAVTRLERLRLTATEDRFDAELGLGRGADLVAELTDLVAAHPVRERLVAALMRALADAGRGSEALLVYERARADLADALGVDPAPELSALHVALLRGELGRREEDRKTNLRAELTSFVGKEADAAGVRALTEEHRLITLTGPGGSGKTRLASETGRTMLGDLPDGVWLVELAPVDRGGDVAQAALSGLGLRDDLLGETSNAELTDRVIAAMRDREALLILDNCEHLIGSAAAFADRVLGECRRLRILATSREPLGITGEALWPVEPLALPEGDTDPGEIESSPAVRLLRDRAGAVRGDLASDHHTASTMVRICRELDGMPLAIELAAARLRTFSLDQLADRLHDRFRLLTGGSRTALPRHKTLRAVVDWSWELLSESERTVLRRLAVFSGGAGLEAAERVCADAGAGQADGVRQEQVLDLLTALTEKSLLRAEGNGAPRYRMLGTIEEYAADRLSDAGEADLARRIHLAHFTELVETAEPRLRRAEQLEWLALLEAEHDNIVSAMRGALAAGEAHAAMRLAGGAGWYWWLSGHKVEGFELIVAATETPGRVPDEIRAMVYALGVMFVNAGRGGERQAAEWISEAHRFSQLSRNSDRRHPLLGLVDPLERMLRAPDTFLSAYEALLDDDEPWVRALARLHLGKSRIMLGQGGRDADTHLERALVEFRSLGDRFGIAFAQTELADRIAVRGEFAAACEHYDQAVEVVTEMGALDDVIRMRARLAQLHWLLGDKDACEAAIAEARRRAERVTWPHTLAELALAAAELARWSGDDAEAHRQLGVATALLGDDAEWSNTRAEVQDLLGYLADDPDEAREHRVAAWQSVSAEEVNAPLYAQVIVGVADLALRLEQYELAARLLAASVGVRGLPNRSHPDVARIEQAARRHLGDARFAAAEREGTEEDWPELVKTALAI
ncbi:BTAD domain-containing putative transcriptional regulator [Nocardiopsis nanhaiensis]